MPRSAAACSLLSPVARSQLPPPGTVFRARCWVFSFLPSPWFLLSLLCWILLLPQLPSLVLMGSLLTLVSHDTCSPITFQNHMAVNTVNIVGILPVSNFYLSPDLPHQLHPHRSVGPLTSPLPCWVAISDLTEPKFKPLCSPAPVLRIRILIPVMHDSTLPAAQAKILAGPFPPANPIGSSFKYCCFQKPITCHHLPASALAHTPHHPGGRGILQKCKSDLCHFPAQSSSLLT